LRTGNWTAVINSLDCCGLLCAATGHPAEAVTAWAAHAASARHQETPDWPPDVRRREGPLRQAGTRSDPTGPGRPSSAARR